jgi:hypothetical protein
MGFFDEKFIEPSVAEKGVKFYANDENKDEWFLVSHSSSSNAQVRKVTEAMALMPEIKKEDEKYDAKLVERYLQTLPLFAKAVVVGWGSVKHKDKIQGLKGKPIEFTKEALDEFIAGAPVPVLEAITEVSRDYTNYTKAKLDEDAKN